MMAPDEEFVVEEMDCASEDGDAEGQEHPGEEDGQFVDGSSAKGSSRLGKAKGNGQGHCKGQGGRPKRGQRRA